MELTGLNFIGNSRSGKGIKTFQGLNPEINKNLDTQYVKATEIEIDKAIQKS